MSRPIARASITILEGERVTPINAKNGRYRPHIVLGPPTQRTTLLKDGMPVEEYLGVTVADGPESVAPGQTAEANLVLIYHPEVPYKGVRPGATFTIREGHKVVGYGTVLARSEDHQ